MVKKLFTFLITAGFCLINANVVYAYSKNEKSLKKIKSEITSKKQEEKNLSQEKSKIEQQIKKIQTQMVHIGKNIKEHELNLNKLGSKISELKSEEVKIKNKIKESQKDIIKAISSLQKLASIPIGALITSPQKPVETIRTAMLLNSVTKYLKSYTEDLKMDLEKLENIRSGISKKRTEIAKISSDMNIKKKEVSSLLKKKKSKGRKISQKVFATSKQIKRLIKESKTIEEFLKKAQKEKRKDSEFVKGMDKNSKFSKLKGQIPTPATGSIITSFGEKEPSGIKSKGLRLQTRKNAQVISPYDGVVVFAGDFKGYGNTIIVYHGDNFYTVLSGLNKLFCEENQSLLAGEPIGEMGTGEKRNLYIELRYKDDPINPLKYFAMA